MADIDISNCENEPIHIPGAIQPHGFLIAMREHDLRVTQVSANVMQLLGKPAEQILELPIADLFGAAIEDRLRAVPAIEPPVPEEFALPVSDTPYHATVHRYRGVLMLELEQDTSMKDAAQAALANAIRKLRAARTLHDLMKAAVQEVRSLTGFDRVMIYCFEADGHGQVIAEAKRDDVDSYLHLHYPASDIPRQARELYLLNPLRLIPRADYKPIPLVPALHPDSGRPLDLSFAVLRSVSPVHCKYLRNLGVNASMSISLVVENRLWGLISCLHEEPKLVSPGLRDACETIGALLSLQIGALRELEFRTERDERFAIVQSLAEAMHNAKEEILDGLTTRADDLMALVGSAGAAVMVGERIVTVGKCPTAAQLEQLTTWVSHRVHESGMYSTYRLMAELPSAESYRDVASGLLAVSLPKPFPNLVLWFRPERIHTVNWGGDPNKPVEVESDSSGLRLNPRHSFELWKEQVEGQADRWTQAELHAAQDLRRFAVELDLHRQVVRERAAVQARDDLVAVVSHDLRGPLQAISMQAIIIKRMIGDIADDKSRRLDHVVDRLQAGAQRMTTLLQDLLDLSKIEAGRFEVRRHPEDVGLLLEEACSILRPLAENKGIAFSYATEQGLYADTDTERLFQVLSNLIGNAIKFTSQDGRIDVVARRDGDCVQFEVSDNGPGIDPTDLPHLFDRYWQSRKQNATGTGLGLYIARGIVAANGGRIWVESELNKGTRFFFTIPVATPPEQLQ